MPTKEEILKVHEDKYDVFLEEGSDYGINPIYGAMEEYSKQEALEYNIFYIDTKMKYLGWSFDNIWSCYQAHKAAKALKIAEAMQTHDDLIKEKK